jgi:hypothetical protein
MVADHAGGLAIVRGPATRSVRKVKSIPQHSRPIAWLTVSTAWPALWIMLAMGDEIRPLAWKICVSPYAGFDSIKTYRFTADKTSVGLGVQRTVLMIMKQSIMGRDITVRDSLKWLNLFRESLYFPTFRRLATLTLAISGMCIFPGFADAQISLVHMTTCGPGPFPATSCAIPPTSAGDLLVVGFQVAGDASTSTVITSISDNVGDPYIEAGNARAVDTASGSVTDIWYARNTSAGATSIAITPTPVATSGAAVVWEFSGADPIAPFDSSAVLNSQAPTATPIGATAIATAAGDAVVSLVAGPGQVTGIATGNGFTSDYALNGDGWAHLIASSAGGFAAEWSESPSGTYASSAAAFRAASVTSYSPCDLNKDGTVDNMDSTLAMNMAVDDTPCTASVEGPFTCTVITVQRVVNASQGRGCITYNNHGIVLTWTTSTAPNVAGYNVYRSTTSAGAYNRLNVAPITGVSYTDSAVIAGQTYYYAVTVIDILGNESAFSNQVAALVPNP